MPIESQISISSCSIASWLPYSSDSYFHHFVFVFVSNLWQIQNYKYEKICFSNGGSVSVLWQGMTGDWGKATCLKLASQLQAVLSLYLNTCPKNSPPSFESNVSRKLSVSDLIPVAGGGCVPLAQLVGLVGGLLPGGFMSSREEGVAGAPSVPPGPVGVGGVLVSQLFSPFTELVFTLGGPSGSCLMGGGLARSVPSPSSLVRPGPREVREAFASAATVLFSFFIAMQLYLPCVTGHHPLQPSQLVPILSEIRKCERFCLIVFWFRLS